MENYCDILKILKQKKPQSLVFWILFKSYLIPGTTQEEENPRLICENYKDKVGEGSYCIVLDN